MNAAIRYLDTLRRREVDGPSIDPDWLREHLGNPPAGSIAIVNARQSALLLEEDRESTRG